MTHLLIQQNHTNSKSPEWIQYILDGELADHNIVICDCERGLWLSLKGFGIISEYLAKSEITQTHESYRNLQTPQFSLITGCENDFGTGEGGRKI